jgi:hypothetical protein
MNIGLRRGVGIRLFLLTALLFLSAASFAETITLRQAVELALKHADGIAISAADTPAPASANSTTVTSLN